MLNVLQLTLEQLRELEAPKPYPSQKFDSPKTLLITTNSLLLTRQTPY